MEVYNTKGARVIIMSPLSVFAIMLMILLNGYGCAAAAVLVKTNTTFRCDGRLDECLIQDDLQLEFLMNAYVSRVLDDAHQPASPGGQANDGTIPVFPTCGGQNYCVPKSGPKGEHGCGPKDPVYRCKPVKP
jgi:hypothetical protein